MNAPRPKRPFALAVALTVSALAGCGLEPDRGSKGQFSAARLRSAELPSAAERTQVEQVVDGDTVALRGLGSSRLIGVDTPETHDGAECFGSEASRFTKRSLPPGTRVEVVLGHEPEDRYGRALVYLWLDDGTLLNEELIERGFATTLAIEPNTDLAPVLERKARRAGAAGRGMWGTCGS